MLLEMSGLSKLYLSNSLGMWEFFFFFSFSFADNYRKRFLSSERQRKLDKQIMDRRGRSPDVRRSRRRDGDVSDKDKKEDNKKKQRAS